MASMLVDIADFITMAPGVGTPGVDVFGGTRASKPDNLVSLYESTGFEPIRGMGRMVMQAMNLNVYVRDLDPELCEERARTIFLMLDMFKGIINGRQYFSILARMSPWSLGSDENQRSQFTCDYLVRVDP